MANDVRVKLTLTVNGETLEYELGEGKPTTSAGGSKNPQAVYPRPRAEGKDLLYEVAGNGRLYFAIPFGNDSDGVKFSQKVMQARDEWQQKDEDVWGTFNGDNEKDGKTYKGTGYWMAGRKPNYGTLTNQDITLILDTFKSFGFVPKETTLLK